MKLYRTNYGLRATAVAVALVASLMGAWKFSEESRPPGIWIKWLHASDHLTRETAVEELGQMGPAARSAVVPLADTLVGDEQSGVRRVAARALTQILTNSDQDRENPAAISALIAALRDRDSKVRTAAAQALGTFRPDPEAAIPALVAVLKDPDEWVRGSAIMALATVVPKNQADRPEVVENVVKGLADPSYHVRESSSYALGFLVRENSGTLIVAFRTPVTNAGSLIAKALRRQGFESNLAAAVLELAVTGDDPKVRAGAMAMLMADSVRSPEPPPGLSEGLKNERPEVRSKFVALLAQSGTRASPWLPALQRLSATDPDPSTRDAADSAIGAINQAVLRQQKILSFDLASLDDRDPAGRFFGLYHLVQLGPDAASAIPRVTELSLNDPDPAVAKAAAEVLKLLRPAVGLKP